MAFIEALDPPDFKMMRNLLSSTSSTVQTTPYQPRSATIVSAIKKQIMSTTTFANTESNTTVENVTDASDLYMLQNCRSRNHQTNNSFRELLRSILSFIHQIDAHMWKYILYFTFFCVLLIILRTMIRRLNDCYRTHRDAYTSKVHMQEYDASTGCSMEDNVNNRSNIKVFDGYQSPMVPQKKPLTMDTVVIF